jgi:tetratricopeptide (TPR) repeat protein
MNFEEAIRQLQAAQGDPEKLTLTTLGIVLADRAPELGPALEAAAVPHWFDTKILSGLLEQDEARATDLLEQLNALPMVESFAARRGWNVHEATRLALRSRLMRDDPDRGRRLSSLAALCFAGDEPYRRIEVVFHRLVAAPEEGAEELERLWKEWDRVGRHESLQALGMALAELLRPGLLARPARARALLHFGLIRRDQLPVLEAEALAREAVTIFHELSNATGEVDARDLLGDILETKGRPANALDEFKACQQFMWQLTQSSPDNPDWQRELSVSHNKVGGVFQAQGRLADVVREYEAGKQIMLRLTQRDPDNPDWQRDLSVSHHNLGRVFQAQGRLADALREFEASKQIMLRLTQRDPDNPDWQRDLSVSHQNVGRVFQDQGWLADALREYEADKQIMLRLTQRDPDNTDWQRDLSVSRQNVGRVFQAQGRLADALREYEADLAIAEHLAAQVPQNDRWEKDLAVTRECIARLRERMAQSG